MNDFTRVGNTLVLIRPRIGQDAANDDTNLIQWRSFCVKYSAILPDNWMRSVSGSQPAWFSFVRTTYDKKATGDQVQHQQVQCRAFRVVVFAGTLKEFALTRGDEIQLHLSDQEIRWSQINHRLSWNSHILCNDAHYYMQDDFRSILEQSAVSSNHCKLLSEAMWYITGMRYDILPGSYRYSMNEGTFQTYYAEDGTLWVRARPNAAGGFYTHPVVTHNQTWEMSLGWYSFFSFNGTLSGFGMNTVKAPLSVTVDTYAGSI